MSEQTMVDPEKLVRTAEVLRGAFAVAELPELADRVAGKDGAIAWQMSGDRDLHGRVRLHLGLKGALVLACQRCLRPMTYDLEHEHALVVVREEAALPELEEEEEDADCILVPSTLAVRDVVVEELLLALPMMPRHEQEDCHGPEEEQEGGGEARVSPFAVLREVRED